MTEFGPVPPIVDTYFGKGPGFAQWEDLKPRELAIVGFHGQVSPEDKITALRVAQAQYEAADPEQGDNSWPFLVAATEIGAALAHAGIKIAA